MDNEIKKQMDKMTKFKTQEEVKAYTEGLEDGANMMQAIIKEENEKSN